jgi:hypothetical protein
MHWPGSAASQGDSAASSGMFLPGSGRLSRASERNAVSYGDGYLSVSTKRNAIVHVSSTRSGELVGHPMGYEWFILTNDAASHGTRLGLLQSGDTTRDVTDATVITYPVTFLDGTESLINIQLHSSRTDVITTVTSTSTQTFISTCSQVGGTGAAHTLTWNAIGPVAI